MAERTALITGASSGIGAACARALAVRGFRVCLMARRRDRLDALCRDINAEHGEGRAIYHAGDVTNERARAEALNLVLSRWGNLDVLVNNAGSALVGAVEEVCLDEARQQFEVNTLAPLAWIQLVGPAMREHREGRIINVSSISGRMAFPTLGIYAATKFALEALSDAARLEYQPYGVSVILVEPAPVLTEIWEKSLEQAKAGLPNPADSPFRDFYEAQNRRAEQMIAGRGASPEIAAKAICRAATARKPKARYSTPFEAKAISLLSHFPTGLRDWVVRQLLGLKLSPRQAAPQASQKTGA